MAHQEFDNPDIEHPALAAFAEVAQEFCDFVERYTSLEPSAFAQRAHLLIATLYTTGLRLPSTDILWSDGAEEPSEDDEPCEPPSPDPDHLAADARHSLFRGLTEHLGAHNSYREVFDPWDAPEDDPVVMGSLADDITDIFADLKAGLRKWTRGETGGALWEWRFGLENHWGEHATGAIRALHTRAAWWDAGWP